MGVLDEDVRFIKGVGEQRAAALYRLGIRDTRGLLCYYPRGYEDRTHFYKISEAPSDESVCIEAMVAAPPMLSRVKRGLELVKLRAVQLT